MTDNLKIIYKILTAFEKSLDQYKKSDVLAFIEYLQKSA